MTFSVQNENNLFDLYRQFIETYPVQNAAFLINNEIQNWSWLDTLTGAAPILLLPGLMGEADTSFLYVLALKAHFRVISLTLPPSVVCVDAIADGVIAIMDNLGIYEATILGGSTGGFLAQILVRRFPMRVERLILTHTGLPNQDRARIAAFFSRLMGLLPFSLVLWLMQISIYGYFPGRSPSDVFWRRHFSDVILRQSQEAMRNRFFLMNDFHRNHHFQFQDLSQWGGKLLIMEMSKDGLTTPTEQAAMRSIYPDASLHVFSQTAHYDSVENPEEQIRVIHQFLMDNLSIKNTGISS